MPKTFYEKEEIAYLKNQVEYPGERSPLNLVLCVLADYEKSLNEWIDCAGMDRKKREKLFREIKLLQEYCTQSIKKGHRQQHKQHQHQSWQPIAKCQTHRV